MSETMIQTVGLTKRYGEKTAVNQLNLSIKKGEVFGLLGPNGAGKTTTTLMLLGLTEPTEGFATIAGRDCTRDPIGVKRSVGYLPDNVGFYNDLTGRENLRFTAALNGMPEKQVEEVTSGTIPKKMLSVAISAGVALAVGVAMIRVLTGISILWFVGIGYAAALLLSFFVPEIFTSIAFDSGGVASGTMTSAFLLPLAVGASFAMGGNIITDAFGVIAMVALFPTITIQVLGLIYKIKIRRSAKEKEISGAKEIIEFHSVPQKIRRKVSAIREKGALHGKHATPPEYPDIIEFENEGRW